MNLVNWSLLRNPLNWLTVWSMILVFGLLCHLGAMYCAQTKIQETK